MAVASEFPGRVCTAADGARANTGMMDAIGVPIRWLDGGWHDSPTLIADTYYQFYGNGWMNHDKGAYSTGNVRGIYASEKISPGATLPDSAIRSTPWVRPAGWSPWAHRETPGPTTSSRRRRHQRWVRGRECRRTQAALRNISRLHGRFTVVEDPQMSAVNRALLLIRSALGVQARTVRRLGR